MPKHEAIGVLTLLPTIMSPPKSLYGAARLEILRLKGELDTHKKSCKRLAFSPDKKLLASADDEGLLAVC